MQIPTLQEARALLAEAGRMNPGPWVAHSENAARAARLLAAKVPGLDPDAAQVLGLLHDIGRRFGVTGNRHVPDGYRFCMAHGWADAARICLTHSFPVADIDACFGSWDLGCTAAQGQADRAFTAQTLAQAPCDDYDRLIQLCDSLAVPTGFCLMEKRWVDVVLRYGPNPLLVPKWKALYAIQHDFEARMGLSVYALLPGVKDNTFRDL